MVEQYDLVFFHHEYISFNNMQHKGIAKEEGWTRILFFLVNYASDNLVLLEKRGETKTS